MILSLVVRGKVPHKVVFLTIDILWILRHLSATLILDKLGKLLDPVVLDFHALLSVSVDTVVSFQLFLQLDDSLISLIQSASQSNHDVSLLE